jgi:hypothetical protein
MLLCFLYRGLHLQSGSRLLSSASRGSDRLSRLTSGVVGRSHGYANPSVYMTGRSIQWAPGAHRLRSE